MLPETDTYIVEEIGYIDEDLERYRRDVGAGFWKPFKSLKQKTIQWRFFLGGMVRVFPSFYSSDSKTNSCPQ